MSQALSVEILKRPSDNTTKYELFQRLNAGGTAANAQELRNCIMIMVSNPYSHFARELADYDPFRIVLSASEDQIEKQRHMEYVSRFLVHTYVPYDGKLDVEEFIDQGVVSLASAGETAQAGHAFRSTFDLLSDSFGADALRRFVNGQPFGRVGLVAFECIAVGVAKNIAIVLSKPDPLDYVRRRIQELWQDPAVDQFFAAGLRGTIRIQRTVPFGARWFAV